MKNIVLTRIDDRLLHGQVVVSWIPFLDANEILIIDDEYASDDFMIQLINESSPDSIKVNVLSVKDSVNYLKTDDRQTDKLLILSRYIEYIKEIIDLGIKISKLNIGGLGFSEGRKKYVNSIYMSSLEIDILEKIKAANVAVEVQMLPNDKIIKF